MNLSFAIIAIEFAFIGLFVAIIEKLVSNSTITAIKVAATNSARFQLMSFYQRKMTFYPKNYNK